jgi:hypothetical protein
MVLSAAIEGSKNLFPNFKTLYGGSIERTDTNSHFSDDSLRADVLASMRQLQGLAE